MDGPTETRRDEQLLSAGVTLRDYMEARLETLDTQLQGLDRVLTTLISSVIATADAQIGTLKERFASVNEFRGTMEDQAHRFATRVEMEAELRSLKLQVADLTKSRDESSGKATQSQVILAALLGVSGLAVGVFGLIR